MFLSRIHATTTQSTGHSGRRTPGYEHGEGVDLSPATTQSTPGGAATIEVSSPTSIDAASTLALTAVCEPITDATCTDRAGTPYHLLVAATMGTLMVLPLEVADAPVNGRLCSYWWSPMLPPSNIDVARTSPEKCIAKFIATIIFQFFYYSTPSDRK
jgi:hypothetical protein